MAEEITRAAVAAREFIDAHTGQKYAEGAPLTGEAWSDQRIARYVAKGIARYVEAEKDVTDGQ